MNVLCERGHRDVDMIIAGQIIDEVNDRGLEIRIAPRLVKIKV